MFSSLSGLDGSVFDQFRRLQEEMDELFGQWSSPTDIQTPAAQVSRATEAESGMRPPVDVFEDADGLTLLADLPGVSKERLHVRVERDTLIVEGDVEIALPEQMQAVYADVRSTHYQRRFALSDELETEKIEASLKDGVLTVRIPKRAETKPRRIEVRTQ